MMSIYSRVRGKPATDSAQSNFLKVSRGLLEDWQREESGRRADGWGRWKNHIREKDSNGRVFGSSFWGKNKHGNKDQESRKRKEKALTLGSEQEEKTKMARTKQLHDESQKKSLKDDLADVNVSSGIKNRATMGRPVPMRKSKGRARRALLSLALLNEGRGRKILEDRITPFPGGLKGGGRHDVRFPRK